MTIDEILDAIDEFGEQFAIEAPEVVRLARIVRAADRLAERAVESGCDLALEDELRDYRKARDGE